MDEIIGKIEEPIEPEIESKTTAKQIITGLVATATIVGGLIIGFQGKTTPKMTYEEAQMLIKIYDHELQKSPNKTLTGVNKDNVIQKMNDKFSARQVASEEDLNGEKINPTDYTLLRSGLIQKSK